MLHFRSRTARIGTAAASCRTGSLQENAASGTSLPEHGDRSAAPMPSSARHEHPSASSTGPPQQIRQIPGAHMINKAPQPINRAEHVYLRKRFLDCADVFLKGSKTERELFTKIGSTLDPDEVSRLIAIKTGHCLTEGPNLFFEYFSDSERKELCLRFIEWCLLQREEERERKKARRRAAVAKEGGAVPAPGAPVGAVGHGPGRGRVPGGVTGTARHDHPDPPGGRGDHDGEQVKKGAEPVPAVQPPKREKRQVLTFAELEARHELELLELELNLKEKQEKKERLMAQLQRVTQEDIIKVPIR